MMEAEVGAEFCFPQLRNLSCRKPSSSWPETLLLNIMLSSISLLTVALNLLVIISVSHFRQLHTPTNILLLSLAASDFLVGLLLMPAEIIVNTTCWFFGDYMCCIYNYLSFILTSASVGDMVLISVDRYVAICEPLRYSSKITEKRAKVCVCLCWLCAVFYTSIFLKDNLSQPGRHNSCYGECVIFIDHIAGTVDLVLTFIAPITAIVILYLRVFTVALSQAHAIRSQVTSITLQVSLPMKKSELKAARTLGILVFVFLICFCPYYGLTLTGDSFISESFSSLVIFLFYFNSCINPLIYALFYPWFRKALKLIVTLQILQPGSCETNML